MDQTENGRPPDQRGAARPDTGIVSQPADNPDVTAVTRLWAAAWLAGPHTDDEHCPTCSAGWSLIGGAP